MAVVRFDSRTFGRFWDYYHSLPRSVQRQADKQHLLFKSDATHASLQLKPTGLFWSARVSRSYRALAVRRDNIFYWFWIGPHDEYDEILRRR